ncbi:hypothetical protein AB4212_67390, partial [Streptomyces sp. 2MCAF27]
MSSAARRAEEPGRQTSRPLPLSLAYWARRVRDESRTRPSRMPRDASGVASTSQQVGGAVGLA